MTKKSLVGSIPTRCGPETSTRPSSHQRYETSQKLAPQPKQKHGITTIAKKSSFKSDLGSWFNPNSSLTVNTELSLQRFSSFHSPVLCYFLFMSQELTKQYLGMLTELLLERELNGGTLPMDVESERSAKLEEIWWQLSDEEQDEVEEVVMRPIEAPVDLGLVDMPAESGLPRRNVPTQEDDR